MNKIRIFLLTATLTPAALWSFGCSQHDQASATVDQAAGDAKGVAANVKASVSDSWDGIKDYTLEKRAEFSASFDRMAGRLDDGIRKLKNDLARAPAAADTDRARALKEYDEARADLKSNLSDLGHATADTWAEAKEKVARAWKRVQAAYDKLAPSAAA